MSPPTKPLAAHASGARLSGAPSTSRLQAIPPEMLQHIVSYLPAADVYRLRGTSRAVSAAIDDLPHPALRRAAGVGPSTWGNNTLAARLARQRQAVGPMARGEATHHDIVLGAATAERKDFFSPFSRTLATTPAGALVDLRLDEPMGAETLLPPGLLRQPFGHAPDRDVLLNVTPLTADRRRRALLTWHAGGEMKVWHLERGKPPVTFAFVDAGRRDLRYAPPSRFLARNYRLGAEGNTATTMDATCTHLQFWRRSENVFRLEHNSLAYTYPMPILADRRALIETDLVHMCPSTGRLAIIADAILSCHDLEMGTSCQVSVNVDTGCTASFVEFSPDGLSLLVQTTKSGLWHSVRTESESNVHIFAPHRRAGGGLELDICAQLPRASGRLTAWDLHDDGAWMLAVRRATYTPGEPLVRHLPPRVRLAPGAAQLLAPKQRALQRAYTKASTQSNHIDILGDDARGNTYHILARGWGRPCALYRIAANSGEICERPFGHLLAAQLQHTAILHGFEGFSYGRGRRSRRLTARWSTDGTTMQLLDINARGTQVLHYIDFTQVSHMPDPLTTVVRALARETWREAVLGSRAMWAEARQYRGRWGIAATAAGAGLQIGIMAHGLAGQGATYAAMAAVVAGYSAVVGLVLFGLNIYLKLLRTRPRTAAGPGLDALAARDRDAPTPQPPC